MNLRFNKKNALSKQNENGFTLIELIVVIAIMSILSLFALPSISQMLEDTTQLDENNELQMSNSAAKQYEAEFGQKAADAEELNKATLANVNQSHYDYTFDAKTGRFTTVVAAVRKK